MCREVTAVCVLAARPPLPSLQPQPHSPAVASDSGAGPMDICTECHTVRPAASKACSGSCSHARIGLSPPRVSLHPTLCPAWAFHSGCSLGTPSAWSPALRAARSPGGCLCGQMPGARWSIGSGQGFGVWEGVQVDWTGCCPSSAPSTQDPCNLSVILSRCRLPGPLLRSGRGSDPGQAGACGPVGSALIGSGGHSLCLLPLGWCQAGRL